MKNIRDKFGNVNLSLMEFKIVSILLKNIVVFIEFRVFIVFFFILLFIDSDCIWFMCVFRFIEIMKFKVR